MNQSQYASSYEKIVLKKQPEVCVELAPIDSPVMCSALIHSCLFCQMMLSVFHRPDLILATSILKNEDDVISKTIFEIAYTDH